MSENKTEYNANPVIESEVVESNNNEEILEKTVTEPVVVKKGSFMGFLAFVFSLAALGLSGYMYYIDHYLVDSNQENSLEDKSNDLLKSSISALEIKTNQFEQLLTTTQDSNQQLGIQLNALKTQVEKNQEELPIPVQTLLEDENIATQTPLQEPVAVSEPFDDSEILQQIVDLQNKIAQQSLLVEQLQNNLNTSNTQNSQSLEKLSTDLQSKISNQSNNLPVVPESNSAKSIAGSLLQQAYVQLDINGNVSKSQDLVNKTIAQLSQLTGIRYGRLSNELQSFSQKLNAIEKPNVESLKSQINQLSQATNQLEFTHGEIIKTENKDASWFDNLISIKKIDESQQPILTKSEQITIGNVISNHYQMLQLALMSGNQELWLSEIKQLQTLLTLNFAENAKDTDQQLTQLATINLNPELPILEPLLHQFKAINLANENE